MVRYGAGPGFIIFEILRALIELGLLVLVVVLCVWAVRRFTRGPGSLVHQLDPAERLLRRRYAAGEIGRDEFLARIADLRNESGPPTGPPPQA